jgi:3-dehydroquinate dehydratase-1
MPARPIVLQDQALAGGRLPAICAPLVARTREDLLAEAAVVAAKQPDLLEWRVDHFAAIANTTEVVATAKALHQAARGIPILFTRRSQREGGEPIAISEPQVLALYRAVCDTGCVALVDFEMDNEPGNVVRMRELARSRKIPLVLSFHDFQKTPSHDELLAKFAKAEELGADIAKLAVMPQALEDVHTLLGATLQASRERAIPVVSMAMGPLGAISRVGGGVFGSALTFAVGASASAPGQMPIEDVRAGVAMLARASAG